MKLILFIGHHKVGSSALQTYLSRQALPLLRQGILYPAVEAQGMATLLALALALDGPDAPAAPLPVNFREAHNALAFGMMAEASPAAHPVPALHAGLPSSSDMLRTIQRQIEVFAPHTVILAAEVFANFGAVGPAMITRLAETFAGAEIHLTATFRRVDDYLVSWHGQRLRFGQTPRSLPGGALQRYFRKIHFNYRLMLEPWLDRMPGAQLRLRPYDQVLAAGGAVRDFLSGHAIDPPPGSLAEPKVNTGLHRAFIEIARLGNRMLPPPEARDLFDGLLRLGALPGLPRPADIEMFGSAARAEMAANFAPIHDWLSARAGEAFFADLAEIGRVRSVHEHAANLTARDLLRAMQPGVFSPVQTAFLADLTLTPNFPCDEIQGVSPA